MVSGRLAGENMVGQSKKFLRVFSTIFILFKHLITEKPYKHQSMFWSDLGPQVGYEAIGIVDATLPTVGVFAKATQKDSPAAAAMDNLNIDGKSDVKEVAVSLDKVKSTKSTSKTTTSDVNRGDPKFGKGVLFYLRDDKVVGIVLWNVFNRINTARAIINENKKWDDLNEVAKLFEIHA